MLFHLPKFVSTLAIVSSLQRRRLFQDNTKSVGTFWRALFKLGPMLSKEGVICCFELLLKSVLHAFRSASCCPFDCLKWVQLPMAVIFRWNIGTS
jgi:hypothetical protein